MEGPLRAYVQDCVEEALARVHEELAVVVASDHTTAAAKAPTITDKINRVTIGRTLTFKDNFPYYATIAARHRSQVETVELEGEQDVVVYVSFVPPCETEAWPAMAMSIEISHSQATEAEVSFALPCALLGEEFSGHQKATAEATARLEAKIKKLVDKIARGFNSGSNHDHLDERDAKRELKGAQTELATLELALNHSAVESRRVRVNAWTHDLLSKLSVAPASGSAPSTLHLHGRESITVLHKEGRVVDDRHLLVSIFAVGDDAGRRCELRVAAVSACTSTHFTLTVGTDDLPFVCSETAAVTGVVKMTDVSAWPTRWAQDLMRRLRLDPASRKMILAPLHSGQSAPGDCGLSREEAAVRLQAKQRQRQAQHDADAKSDQIAVERVRRDSLSSGFVLKFDEHALSMKKEEVDTKKYAIVQLQSLQRQLQGQREADEMSDQIAIEQARRQSCSSGFVLKFDEHALNMKKTELEIKTNATLRLQCWQRRIQAARRVKEKLLEGTCDSTVSICRTTTFKGSPYFVSVSARARNGVVKVASESDVVVCVNFVPPMETNEMVLATTAMSIEIGLDQAMDAELHFSLPFLLLRNESPRLSGADRRFHANAWTRDLLSKLSVAPSSDGTSSQLYLHPRGSVTMLYKKGHKVDSQQLLVSVFSVCNAAGKTCELHLTAVSAFSNRHFACVIAENELPFEWSETTQNGSKQMTVTSTWPANWAQDLIVRLSVDTVSSKLRLSAMVPAEDTNENSKDKAARRLQSQQRGLLARKEVHQLRERNIAIKQEVALVEGSAAATIQASARRRQNAQELVSGVLSRCAEHNSTTTVEESVRGDVAREYVNKIVTSASST
jgi:hypothetical protein